MTSNSNSTGRATYNRAYWDELDRQAEELDKPFKKNSEIVELTSQEWLDLKSLHESELIELRNEIQDHVAHVKELKDQFITISQRYKQASNYLTQYSALVYDVETQIINLSTLLKSSLQFMSHKEDCRYIDKLCSGRKLEVEEHIDCTCGYARLVNTDIKRARELASEEDIAKKMTDLNTQVSEMKYGNGKYATRKEY